MTVTFVVPPVGVVYDIKYGVQLENDVHPPDCDSAVVPRVSVNVPLLFAVISLPLRSMSLPAFTPGPSGVVFRGMMALPSTVVNWPTPVTNGSYDRV